MASLTERQVVDKVKCPTCHQPRGYWCRTKSGELYTRIHATRHRKAGSGWGSGRHERTSRK